MLGNRKVIVDSFCEVKEFTTSFEDDRFYDFQTHELVPNAIYIISRQTFHKNIELIRDVAEKKIILPVLGNPAEGSETIWSQIVNLNIQSLVQQKHIAIIGGAPMQEDIPCFWFENFLPKILDYAENLSAIESYKQHWADARPYNFLFLNGRGRPHRRYLLHRLQQLLPQSIWTNLDSTHGQPIKLLDSRYEFDFYQNNKLTPKRSAKTYKCKGCDTQISGGGKYCSVECYDYTRRKNVNLSQNGFVKYDLFNQQWGEIYLKAEPYLDSYFSLVTETVFEYPYSFRTEKIWKPIAIGHPFVVAANHGYYRDLHQLGFQTFGHLIDESFDSIVDSTQRLEQVAREVEWLCQQDLAKFAREAYNICKYNQQLLADLRIKTRQELPDRISTFLKSYQ